MYKKINDLLKDKYGVKVYKLSLDAGCTCPNRDGTISYGGCIFCSEGGSGDFAQKQLNDITAQIEMAKLKVAKKVKPDSKYIAYFQSFTNTYGDPERLKMLFTQALNHPDIVGLSIGTRPDCISQDCLEMLKELNKIKPVWIELGLQTIHESTAKLINRGYSLPVFTDTYQRLKAAGLTVIVHVILGLPYENKKMMRETVTFLSSLNPFLDGIKLQLLHVLKNTALEKMYLENPDCLYPFTMEDYIQFVEELITLLPEETVVHRITGDGPKSLLIAPKWSANKRLVMNSFAKYEREFYEGN